MGSCLTTRRKLAKSSPQAATTTDIVICLGLRGTGKSTFLDKLHSLMTETTTTSTAANSVTIRLLDNVTFQVCDMDMMQQQQPHDNEHAPHGNRNRRRRRSFWWHFLPETAPQGLFYMVDLASFQSTKVCEDLRATLEDYDEYLAQVPIVILLNKKDELPSGDDVAKTESLVKATFAELVFETRMDADRWLWCVQSTCALSGDGVLEALVKMAELIQNRRKMIAQIKNESIEKKR